MGTTVNKVVGDVAVNRLGDVCLYDQKSSRYDCFWYNAGAMCVIEIEYLPDWLKDISWENEPVVVDVHISLSDFGIKVR